MHSPSQSEAIEQKGRAVIRTQRPVLVWIISLYSVIWALFSYVSLVTLFITDPSASSLLGYQRIYMYFLPGLHLFASGALFFLKRVAFPLYVAYFVGLLVVPVMASNVYADPYLTTNWLDIYKNAAKGIMGIGWLMALAVAGYVGYLYRRGTLK